MKNVTFIVCKPEKTVFVRYWNLLNTLIFKKKYPYFLSTISFKTFSGSFSRYYNENLFFFSPKYFCHFFKLRYMPQCVTSYNFEMEKCFSFCVISPLLFSRCVSPLCLPTRGDSCELRRWNVFSFFFSNLGLDWVLFFFSRGFETSHWITFKKDVDKVWIRVW